MKKFLALAALVLGLASCQTEPEGLDVNVGGVVDTVVTVNIPEAETRANNSGIGVFENGVLDGAATMRYIFQVYYRAEDGTVTKSTERQVKYTDGTSVTFPVRLIPGRDYQFVVWADVVTSEDDTDNHYNTTNLETVSVIESSWNAMDETRDAFTASYAADDYNGSQSINIDLYRPFAKLRVIATDYDELAKIGIEVKKAAVNYTTVHRSTFNAYTSKAVETNVASIDKDHSTYEIATYANETGDEHTIFSDYFFAENDVVKFEITVYDQNDDEIVTRALTTDIYAKRNYLTTIKGDILTDGNNVNVTVKPGFDGENGKVDGETFAKVDTAEEFLEAFNKGVENITLEGNINLNDLLAAGTLSTRAGEEPAFVVAAGKKLTIDLNGYTISETKTQTAAHSMITNKGTLTIVDSKSNGKIYYRDEGNGGNYVSNTIQNSGVLTIEGGIIENNSTETVADNGFPHPIDNSGKLVINGGTFTNNANYSSMRIWCTTDDDTEVTINGGTFNGSIDLQSVNANANKGVLTINGGTFNADTHCGCAVRFLGFGVDVDEIFGYINGGTFNGKIKLNNYVGGEFNSQVFFISGGTFSVDPSEFVADGYQALQYETNGFYTVQAIDAATRTITINSLEEYLNLNALNDKWVEFFSNGQGKEYSNYAPQNGGKGTDFYYKWGWTIKLNTDIDLKDVTALVPTNLESFGYFDGNGHTIKNATITTTSDAGLFRAGHAAVKNLNLYNIKVNGGNDASVGILTSDCHASVDNITIVNSSVEGGKYVGGAVGYGYCDVTNCTLTNCVVKGSYKFGGVIGYICASNDNLGNVDNNTLTDCTVEWTGNYSSGKDTVVMGKVVGNFNCDGTCNGNVITNMTTTATSLIGKIEAGKNVEGQNSATASNTEDLKEALKDNTVSEVSVTAGEYTFPASDIKAGTTITCEEGTVFKGTSSLNIKGATVIGATFKNDNGIAVRETIHGNFKNCTFDASEALRWCYSTAGETSVFENCVVKTDFRGVHFDGLHGTVIFKNCEINGFNAFGGNGKVIFENCTMGCDQSSYNGLNLYLDTTIIGCKFIFLSGKTNFIDMEAAGKTLTIKNCTATLDGAAANVADYVGGSKKGDCTVTIE